MDKNEDDIEKKYEPIDETKGSEKESTKELKKDHFETDKYQSGKPKRIIIKAIISQDVKS